MGGSVAKYVRNMGKLRNSETALECDRRVSEKWEEWRVAETNDIGRMGKNESTSQNSLHEYYA